MNLVKLSQSNGTWDGFIQNWSRQCEEVGEDIDNYASDALIPIQELAMNEDASSWAVALEESGRFTAAFLVHRVNQKGYDAPVLRVRHIVVCPMLDQGFLSADSYGDTLIGLLFESLRLSEEKLPATFIKMHVRSPADLNYFRALGPALDRQGIFDSTELKGAWLPLKRAASLRIWRSTYERERRNCSLSSH